MNDFLPEGYEIPDATNGYMKFKQGENRFRVLSSAILGYEAWQDTENGKRKPLRWRMGVSIPVSEGEDAKHFWAFIVWNYQERKIQILEITQKTIMNSIKTLTKDSDWGSPKDYDLVVIKEGEGMETEYQTQPKPKKEVEKDILKIYNGLTINLEALFDGKDPFKAEETESKEMTDEEFDKIMKS